MQARNKVVAENQLAGNPSTEWDINGMGDPTIQGFGHDISINVGETIDFKIKTESIDYRIDIYRMGYYGGMGARKVDTLLPSAELPQMQPEGFTDPTTKLYDCGNWAVSASWQCPTDAVSGIYFARLVRQDPSPTTWRQEIVKTSDTASPEAREHAYGASGHGEPLPYNRRGRRVNADWPWSAAVGFLSCTQGLCARNQR